MHVCISANRGYWSLGRGGPSVICVQSGDFFFSLVDRLQAIWVHTFSCPASALYHSIDPACTW